MAIVASATNAERPVLPVSPLERRLESIRQWLASHAMYAALVMLAAAAIAFYTKSQPLANTTLALGLIAQLLTIAMMIPVIVSGVVFLLSLRKSPYRFFLELVQTSAQLNLVHAEALAKCPRQAVQYVLGYYKYERNGYERRAGMLAGAVDRIGIFPALAALILLIWNLLKVPGATGWAGFFGPLLLAFYFMAMASAGMTHKMDKVIALLEYSVQSRK